MQFIFVSAFSSSNHGGNIHTAVFGFYLKYIFMHTPNCEFVLEKTKEKECACCLKWTVLKAPLSLGAWRECSRVLVQPYETASLKWKFMTVEVLLFICRWATAFWRSNFRILSASIFSLCMRLVQCESCWLMLGQPLQCSVLSATPRLAVTGFSSRTQFPVLVILSVQVSMYRPLSSPSY